MWRSGLVDLQHVGSSRTRTRTRVPCIGRRILNHCATREAPCILLKALNACCQLLTTKQMISLRLEHQKGNKKYDQLKNCEPEVVTCEYHRDSTKKTFMTCECHSKSCDENFRLIAGNGANALNFDHISQLNSGSFSLITILGQEHLGRRFGG